ncbi:MAG TPA: ABC transporter substrate-binding protein [Solirubrobacteraceae bacterium]|jgi:polar amino acid transport system substrate-binding protein|nr:ABC transporter substrate-binding protein [Solirubrobacteraceae bacterium]
MGNRKIIGRVLAAAGASAALACCASASASASTGAVSSIAKLVPSAIKAKGTLTVAADASYAPDEFIGSNGKTVVGMDADLSAALAKVMGLKVSVANVTFDNIIPAMVAGRYIMGASSFTDTKAREKQVNFVDYAKVGESFYTKASGGTSIKGIANICGLTVSVETGTTEQIDAKAQSTKCTKAGKKAVNVTPFPNQNQANLAVSSGRAQLGFADTPVADYQVKQSHGAFKLTGTAYATSPYGLAVSKSSGMTNAVKAALVYLIKNGTYGQIFKKWGVQSIEVPASFVKINGASR